MDDTSGPGRWLAVGSGIVTGLVVLGLVAVYFYGLALPARHEVRAGATLRGVAPEAVWALLGDPARRPEWRPAVDRIAHIDDRGGRPVWRELDHDGDRFDFLVARSDPPRTLVLEVAASDQIGFSGSWTWELSPAPGGTEVTVTEDGTIDNPFFRGLHALRSSPWDTVEDELRMLSAHLGAPAEIERR